MLPELNLVLQTKTYRSKEASSESDATVAAGGEVAASADNNAGGN